LLLAACAGRRGWLFCLPLLLVLPQTGQAFEFEDLWLRPDQQGQHLLKQKRPAEAAAHFEDRQWQGVALYEAGNYSEAARRFAEGTDARAHYNRGNALAKSGELEAAVDAYEQALELQPDLRPAQTNKTLVQSLLNEQAAPEQTPKPTQNEEPGPAEQAPDAASSAQSSEPGQPSAETATPQEQSQAHPAPPSGAQDVPGSELPDEQTTTPPLRPAAGQRNEEEQRQALEQWLRQIPDNPGELLRRKFWYEQQSHQAQGKTP